MKTYVLILSKVFPVYHYREGEPTNFKDAFMAGQVFNNGSECLYRHPKLHTIRANYELWAKRFEKIERGEAQLSIRQWSGKPYKSKQELICNLTKADGIGLQQMTIIGSSISHSKYVDDYLVNCKTLAHNDGLAEVDWRKWFERYYITKPLAVIHFTNFRYKR